MGRFRHRSSEAEIAFAASVVAALPYTVLVVDYDLLVVCAGIEEGWGPKELVGRRLADALPDTYEDLIAGCRAAVEDGVASAFDLHDDATGKSFRCHVAPRFEKSRPTGAVVTIEPAATPDVSLVAAEEDDVFGEAFAAASVGMAIVALDGTFLRVNARLVEMTGYTEDVLLGLRLAQLADPTGPPIDEEALTRLAAMELDGYAHEGRYVRSGGGTFQGSVRLARVADEQRRPLFFLAHIADTGEGEATEEVLRQVTQRFESAFENAPVGMALLTKDGQPFQVNRALAELTGYTAGELLSVPPIDLVHPDDVTSDIQKQGEQLLAGELDSFQCEMRWFDAHGHVIWVSVQASTVFGPARRPNHFVVHVSDVSGRRRVLDRMENLANQDWLTGLRNRRSFEAALGETVARSRRYGETAALLVVDLDRFKQVNDVFGHAVGDTLLRHVAGLLQERLRDSDVIGRLGGDEFGVLLHHANERHAHRVAADIANAVAAQRMSHDGNVVECSASIGVAFVNESTTSGEDLLVAADRAMYRAKGKARPGPDS